MKGIIMLIIILLSYAEFKTDYDASLEPKIKHQCEGKARLDCHYPRYRTLEEMGNE